jgi:thioredoxin reductase (NADPH)
MHQSSILGELVTSDAAKFGWVAGGAGAAADGGGKAAPLAATHNWEIMVDQVQRYIKSLNFQYRVALRDADVKYINGLGEFSGPHSVKVTEFKGKAKTPKEKTLTAARFLVATGGRPTALSCPGAEFAITSDDIFSLKTSPRKTCFVGAGYVSLECAGFLTALGCDTTVLVRSILLRGFDRECCEKIEGFMAKSGTKILKGVTPAGIEKQADGRLKVTLSDGSADVYDTVVAAVGRTADTAGLNLGAVGVEASPRNAKLDTVHEQTHVPHVYAIGDVLQGKPELTPVAIQAGVLLARRLFDGKTVTMEYSKVATAVFTPLEYGAVGLSEDEAMEKYGGTCGVEVYHQTFVPLEWSLSMEHRGTDSHPAFIKVVCNKNDCNRVLGMHYLGPNAGEVIQGYAVGLKKNICFCDLMDTVGIHPTTSEWFTTVNVTKSSGASVAAAGC